jgi:hypothetical protein
MKSALLLVSAFGVFVAADHLRSLMQNQLHAAALAGRSELPSLLGSTVSFVLANVAVYLAVFAVAGAVVAALASRRWAGIALAALVGAASPLSTLPFESVQPFTWATHAPRWLEFLFWANWYAPPVAALLGAFLVVGVRARTGATAHAA